MDLRIVWHILSCHEDVLSIHLRLSLSLQIVKWFQKYNVPECPINQDWSVMGRTRGALEPFDGKRGERLLYIQITDLANILMMRTMCIPPLLLGGKVNNSCWPVCLLCTIYWSCMGPFFLVWRRTVEHLWLCSGSRNMLIHAFVNIYRGNFGDCLRDGGGGQHRVTPNTPVAAAHMTTSAWWMKMLI
jgi:hypothetical protein